MMDSLENRASLSLPEEKREAKFTLASAGLSIRPLDSETYQNMYFRDLSLDPRSGLGNPEYVDPGHSGRSFDAVFFNEIPLGYVITDHVGRNLPSGAWQEQGELSKVQTSLPVRDLKLGALLIYTALQKLAQEDMPVIRSVILDETGKMEHILNSLGFIRVNPAQEPRPKLEIDLQDENKKQSLLSLLEEKIQGVLKFFIEHRQDLESTVKQVDYDNPYEHPDILKIVEERLKDNPLDRTIGHITYFGQGRQPIMLTKGIQRAEENGRFGITLRIKTKDIEDLKEIVEANAAGMSLEPRYTLSTDETKRNSEVEISSPYSADFATQKGYLLKLAEIAEIWTKKQPAFLQREK